MQPQHPGGASLIAQLVKNLPAVQESLVRFLGLEDPLQKGMATHSSILAWRIPWTGEPNGLQSMGSQKNQTGLTLSLFHLSPELWTSAKLCHLILSTSKTASFSQQGWSFLFGPLFGLITLLLGVFQQLPFRTYYSFCFPSSSRLPPSPPIIPPAS